MIRFLKHLVCLLMLFFFLSSYAQNGIYLALEAGYSDLIDMPNAQAVDASWVSKNTFPHFRGSVGYLHELYRYYAIGFEVGLGSHGNYQYVFDDSIITTKTLSVEFLINNTFHVSGNIDLIIKFGPIRNKFYVQSFNPLYDDNTTKVHGMVMVGANYHLNKHFAFTLGYSRSFSSDETINLNSVSSGAPEINAFLVGIRLTSF